MGIEQKGGDRGTQKAHEIWNELHFDRLKRVSISEFFSLSHLIGWEGGEMFLSQWQGIEAKTQLQWTLQQEIILQYF